MSGMVEVICVVQRPVCRDGLRWHITGRLRRLEAGRHYEFCLEESIS